MVINHIGTNNSILNKFIAEIRDVSIQKDSLRTLPTPRMKLAHS